VSRPRERGRAGLRLRRRPCRCEDRVAERASGPGLRSV